MRGALIALGIVLVAIVVLPVLFVAVELSRRRRQNTEDGRMKVLFVAAVIAVVMTISQKGLFYVSCNNPAYTWLCCLVYSDCGGGG